LGLWASGLATLGAVVVPIVFRTVPAPANADAMTLVFRRFDAVAIACAAVVVVALVTEAAVGWRSTERTLAGVLRAACVVGAAALAIAIAVWISPGIAELHRAGAVRHVGASGAALEAMHRTAESLAKGELLLLFVAFVLTVARLTRPHIPGTGPA
jgi:Domain of unknown function (DUF4149)